MSKTYIDIAKELGVSISTVSRALNGKSGISDKTREKVLKTAEKLNYVPNQTAINLVTKSSNTIAAIIPDIMNFYYSEIIQKLEAVFKENNMSFILCITNESDEMVDYYLRDLLKKRVAGIVLLSLYVNNTKLLKQVQENTALVGISTGHENIDRVECTEHRGVYDVICHLIELGHKRIAFVGYKLFDNRVIAIRLQAYKKALEDAGISFDEELIIETNALHMPQTQSIEKLFKINNPPTAIHCMNEYTAMGVYSSLTSLGFSVPKDVSLSAQDGLTLTSIVHPDLTTIVTPIDKMATSAATLLLDRIKNGKDDAFHTVLFNNHLKIGGSTAEINVN